MNEPNKWGKKIIYKITCLVYNWTASQKFLKFTLEIQFEYNIEND